VKKVLLVIATILILLVIASGLLYYFRKPVWNYYFVEQEANYPEILRMLEKKSELNYEGDIALMRVTYRDGNMNIYPSLMGDTVVLLKEDKMKDLEIEPPSITEDRAVHVVLLFEKEKKSLIDEISCSYLKKENCNVGLNLSSWSIKEYKYD
jgi:hypothetical protein